MDRDRNLLFGVFAVQLRKVTPSQIMAAAAAWATDQSKDLPSRLKEDQGLSERDCDLIARLVDEAIGAYGGDVGATLAAFGGPDQVEQSFGHSLMLTPGGGVAVTIPTPEGTARTRISAQSVSAVRETIGRYKQLCEHARGGMGRVLLVHDEFLGRDIALKELLPGFGGTPVSPSDAQSPVRATVSFLSRFLQEARITGQLEHPSIVPVYELGHRSDGTLYYTMKLVRGRTLADAVRESKDLADRLALLPHFVDLCLAIAYAHNRGVIHRDIKPQNVMVGEFGETVVLDWGLAKAKDREDVHADGLAETFRLLHLGNENAVAETLYGQILGTPVYASPEQISGQLHLIDERSDIYSLGAVLYQLLTGRTPFSGSLKQVLDRVLGESPRPIRDFSPHVALELVAICERAMEKDPENRYATAKELAEEIRRFQSGALVRAYRYGLIDLAIRFVSRYRALLSVGAAAGLLLVFGGILSYFNILAARDREHDQRIEAERAYALAEEARGRAEDAGYHSSILLAQNLIEDAEFIEAQNVLWETPESLRGWEWGYLLRECNRDTATITGSQGGLITAELSPDGTRLCLGAVRGGAIMIDFATKKEIFRIKDDWDYWTSATFSRDGTQVLVTLGGGSSFLCDAQTGEIRRALGTVQDLGELLGEFSPDGRQVIQCSSVRQNAILVWSVETGELLKVIEIPNETVRSVRFNATGALAVAGTSSGKALVVDLKSGEILERYGVDSASDSIDDASISPDDQFVLSGHASGAARLWRRDTGALVHTMEHHDAAIRTVAFARGGEWVLTGSDDRTAVVARVEDGVKLATLRGHSNSVLSVQCSQSGGTIITAGHDGEARIWDVDSVLQHESVRVAAQGIQHAALSPRGDKIFVVPVTGNLYDPAVHVFDRATGEEVAAYTGFANEVVRVDQSHDGNRMAVVDMNKAVYLLDSATGDIVAELRGHESTIDDVDFSSDDKRVVTASTDGTAGVWEPQTGGLIHRLTGHQHFVLRAEFSPDDSHILTVAKDSTARIWDVETGESVAEFQSQEAGDLQRGVFDISGESVWIGAVDGRLYQWDWRKNVTTKEITAHAGSILDIALSPDNSRLLTSALDSSVRLFDTATGGELLRFDDLGSNSNYLDWTADGKVLVHVQNDNEIIMRTAEPWIPTDLPGEQSAPWPSRYEQFKHVARETSQTKSPSTTPVSHMVTITEVGASERFNRIADMIELGTAGADVSLPDGIRIDAQNLYRIVRRFGLKPGDRITALNGGPLTSSRDTLDRFRSAAASPMQATSMTVIRGSRERDVEFRFREPTFQTQDAALNRAFAALIVSSLEDIRDRKEFILQLQQMMARNYGVPVDGDRIDGLWVLDMPEELGDDVDSTWAAYMNQFFRSVGIYNFDRIDSVNDTKLHTLEDVVDSIAAGRTAILSGAPFTYRLVVERTPFDFRVINVIVE